MDGRSSSVFARGQLCCHCLLLETADGLVLIDTGLGLRDVHAPRARLSGFFLKLLSPDFREEMTAVRQVVQLGLDPADVRHIILTHLDFDHAGGLDDFPNARIHLLQAERDAAALQQTWLDRQRFRPQQWSSRPRWEVYLPEDGSDWFGFSHAGKIRGLGADVMLVPLPGHTLGHAGVAVWAEQRWLFMVGDAYFHHEEMNVAHPRCTPGLRLYQRMMDKDRKARLSNQHRLRTIKQAYPRDVEIFCAHDTLEFQRLARRSAKVPATAVGAEVVNPGY